MSVVKKTETPNQNPGSATQSPGPRRKWTSVQVADQMFKDAFVVKKSRFSHLYPDLSDEELNQMTVEYFKKLNGMPSCD